MFQTIIQDILQDIPYHIRQSQRSKRLQLMLQDDGLEIVIPKQGVREDRLFRFLKDQYPWIQKQWQKRQAGVHSQIPWPTMWDSGESLNVAGQRLTISCQSAHQRVGVVGTTFFLGTQGENTLEARRRRILSWYQEQALIQAKEKILAYSSVLGRSPTAISVVQTKSSWGSCSYYGKIQLNWLLMLAPKQVFDYVILHELCHLFFFSHGVRFWQKVECQMPGYRTAKAWLREKGTYLRPPPQI